MMNATDADIETLKAAIRDVPDFPKPGIMFKDITPLLNDTALFGLAVKLLAAPYKGRGITKVIGMEARGFIFAAPVALELGAGFTPVRKKGKLPYRTVSVTYDLEYGQDTLQIHEDAIKTGEKILIVDDVLATGGTAAAAVRLVERCGAVVAGLAVVIDLSFLPWRNALPGRNVQALVRY